MSRPSMADAERSPTASAETHVATDALVEDLRAQYGELRETHISWVFLSAERVLKVKKPVSLGFLDFRSEQARKEACEAELVLNRRLAPDVYLRVVAIHRDAGGKHRVEGPGERVDWGVEMVRLPDRDAADQRLRAGRLTREHITALGRRLASFHARARFDSQTAGFGTPTAISRNVRENFEQTRDSAAAHLSREQVMEIEHYQLGLVESEHKLFETRAAGGFVRDGHGDLRLEHVYIGDDASVRIIDCIEFNERFRYADVCADLAFLSMDLRWHERSDLAEALLAAYARESNDFEMYRLINFYESYRAYVRAKVESIVEADPGIAEPARERAATQARKHYLLALSSARPALRKPFICIVGGIIASGKSTFAERLATELWVPIIDADRTRKHLEQVEPTHVLQAEAFSGAYSGTATRKVYAELRARVVAVLTSGRSVIVDASLRSRSERAAFRALADLLGASFHMLECRAPIETCRQRLRTRNEGAVVSDARESLLDDFVAHYEQVDELPAEQHTVIDTADTSDLEVRAIADMLRNDATASEPAR